ncbi:hypothetical protein IF1G_05077 [Cordyceps javanica]|uniref:Uncharacterized protein n=1 Tax=Cordyceps javanica TaxID=43265 RepID=A0A545V462_9HYPO|nr:hypothetical protein IF1G_05077 [Cordyceps javanica]
MIDIEDDGCTKQCCSQAAKEVLYTVTWMIRKKQLSPSLARVRKDTSLATTGARHFMLFSADARCVSGEGCRVLIVVGLQCKPAQTWENRPSFTKKKKVLFDRAWRNGVATHRGTNRPNELGPLSALVLVVLEDGGQKTCMLSSSLGTQDYSKLGMS